VLAEPPLHIGGDSRVQTAIRTTQHVNTPG
jgi:hypothetical protein